MEDKNLDFNKYERDLPAGFKFLVLILGGGGLFAILISHGIYWYYRLNFVATEQAANFPADAWGQYGDFIGGISNPILSLLTFAGLLYTIVVQRSELTLQRRELANSSQALKATEEELRQTKEIAAGQAEFYVRESKKSELEKVLAILGSSIDGKLNYSNRGFLGKSVEYYLISYTSYYIKRISGKEITLNEVNRDLIGQSADEEVLQISSAIILDFINLDVFMGEYEKYDDRSPTLFYYHKKYIHVVRKINNVKILTHEFTNISKDRTL